MDSLMDQKTNFNASSTRTLLCLKGRPLLVLLLLLLVLSKVESGKKSPAAAKPLPNETPKEEQAC